MSAQQPADTRSHEQQSHADISDNAQAEWNISKQYMSGQGQVRAQALMSGQSQVTAQSLMSGQGQVTAQSLMSGQGQVRAQSLMSGQS